MRPVDSAYDRMAARAAADAAAITERLRNAQTIPYADWESLNDMSRALLTHDMEIVEEPGEGYRIHG